MIIKVIIENKVDSLKRIAGNMIKILSIHSNGDVLEFLLRNLNVLLPFEIINLRKTRV